MSVVPDWAPWPGAGSPTTLVVEAFGTLARDEVASDDARAAEDLYSVFLAHATLMGWSATTIPQACVRLWGMNDAELTPDEDGARIGWAQVALEAGVAPAAALPALLRCLHESIERFGAVELCGVQVTGTGLAPDAREADGLASCFNWFDAGPREPAGALVLIDGAPHADRAESQLLDRLAYLNTGPFTFGAAPDRSPGPGEPSRLPPFRGRAPLAVWATLPESTIAAASWALALVVRECCGDRPEVRDVVARVEWWRALSERPPAGGS